MSRKEFLFTIRKMRQLRRRPNLVALRSAPGPESLADLALIPAARNLGIAVSLLKADQRREATAAILACRVLDAYEDLADCSSAREGVLMAAAFLCGNSDTPVQIDPKKSARDSEAVDLVLTERIKDIRALLSALPQERQTHVHQMLLDVAQVMSRNLESPLPRAEYAEGVLGRVTLYACSFLSTDLDNDSDIAELAKYVGIVAQLANDLRDGEKTLYGAEDREELTLRVILRLFVPALCSFSLLDRIGPSAADQRARAAIAYMAITTTAFLCSSVGARKPYRWQFAAAVLAARSPKNWNKMLEQVQQSADSAILHVLGASSRTADDSSKMQVFRLHRSLTKSVESMIVEAIFALVDSLPAEPLTEKQLDVSALVMMVADHIAFGAVERLGSNNVAGMRALANKFKLAALHSATPRNKEGIF